jgi:hypothetical protein
MRWSRAFVAAIFVLAVAACSTPATSSSGPDGNGNGNGGSSQGAPASPPAAQSQDDGNGGNGGNGGSAGDVNDVFDALIPPNSTEVLKTTSGNSIFASYTSNDSIESLTSHYESAIPGTGMEIFSTTNAQGGTAWVFAESEGSSFGGSVSVFPNTNGEGTAITVTITGE